MENVLKKVILLLILLILTSSYLFCDEITGSIEVGYIPLDAIKMLERSTVNYDNYFYMDISIRYSIIDFIFIGGSVKTFMSMIDNYLYFDPQEIHYKFETGLKFNNFEAGFRHFCCHPVITYLNRGEDININYEGAYEEVYLKLNF